MNGLALQHQVLGVQRARQGAGQVVPEDLVLCAECGWKRLSDYSLHLEDLLTTHNARIASEAAERGWDEGVDAFDEAHGRDNCEPWGYLPDNPYRAARED